MSKGIMINCKQATEMAVKKNLEKLSLGDWFRMQFHLVMCKYCRRFAIQNKFMDKAIHRLDHHTHHHDVPEDFKERVLQELEK